MSTLYEMSVKLSLQASAFSSGLKLAVNALGNFVKHAAEAQGATDKLNGSLRLIAAGAVVTGVGFLLAKGLGDAAAKGAALQVIMAQVGLATGASAQQMAALQQQFVAIGLKNQMSLGDVAQVALAETHNGLRTPGQIKATVGTIANYAEVQQLQNGTDRGSAASTAAQYAHLFNAWTPTLLNPLVNGLSKALTSVHMSGTGFLSLVSQFSGITSGLYGTGTRNKLRLEGDDTLMGVLLGQMGQGTRGGTQFSSALARMASATSGAALRGRNALEHYGHGSIFDKKTGVYEGDKNLLSVLATAAKNVGNPETLAQINKAAFGMVGARLFGMLEQPGMAQRWDQNAASFARTPNLDVQQRVMNATNAGQSQQLHKNIETLVTLFGQALLPIMVKVTSAFVGLTKGAVEFASAHPGLMKIVAAVAAITTGLALVVGPILMAVGAVGLLSVAFGAMDIALLPFTAIVVAVVAAIAGIVWAFTHWGNIVKFFQGVWGGFTKSFGPMLMMLSLVSPLIGPIVVAFKEWGNVTSWLGSVMDKLGTALNAVLTAMGLIHNVGKKPPTVYVPPSTVAAAQHKPGGIQATAPLGGTTNTTGATIVVPKILHPHAPSAPAPSRHGGGGHVTINHHNTFHINGSDHRSTEALAKVVAKHVQAVQGKELTHAANNHALNHHGLNPRYS